MKKILILTNFDVGLYNFRKELIKVLMDKGSKVYISLPYGKYVDKLVQMGCEFIDTFVDRRGINPLTDIKLVLNYRRIIKNVKPDMVITYTVKPNIYGGLVCRLYNIPYASNITGLGTAFQNNGLLKKLIIFLYKNSLKKAGVVLFENVGNKQVFLENNIIDDSKCFVLNGAGVNTDEYSFTPMPEGEIIRFLFIGRIMKEKGVDELFEAAKRIKADFNNVEFDIVGPFEDSYEKIVKELEKERIINFYGFQTDVKTYIRQAHCFVLPSYHEGMANTLLESASMGRPLITNDIHGCREVVKEGENGFLCEVRNSNDLYSKIRQFIEIPVNKKADMGRESRNHVEKLFDKRLVVDRTIEVIDICLCKGDLTWNQ